MDAPSPLSDLFSRSVLEFPAILDLLRPFVSSPLSEPALDALEPRSAPCAEIERELGVAREARDHLREGSRPALRSLGDPRDILESLCVEGVSLTALEIEVLIETARATSSVRGIFSETPFTRLDELARSLPDVQDLVHSLDGKILPGGVVDSSASPALGRIRRALGHTQAELQSTLEKVMRRLGQDELLREELITLRNGRFVLPVRAEKKRRVEGIVHGASSSGQSVYVEPLETLPLNNDLVELQDKEAEEVRRVLRDFSEQLHTRREDLSEAVRILSEIDLAFAKAEFATQYGGCIPELTVGGSGLILSQARHPLLIRALQGSGREPVPLTVELHAPQTLIVISGPNTGGKTLALKTVGTAVLMAQAGLPVIAEEARLPLFSAVLADIGDQQSIDRNLSTFSAHIRNIQAMAERADSRTLVLLDEIGGSTDPHEGAALAVAILERFRRLGAIVMASTHHSRLKAYAAETPQALNAAMDFDEETLLPTYRLLAGLPGKSSGLDIALRLGLDTEIVEQARALLGPAETEVAALVASLHAKREEMDAALERARAQGRDLEARERRLKEEAAAARQAKLRELDRRFEATLRDYSERWKTALDELRKQAQNESRSSRALAGASRKGENLARNAREEWNVQVLEAIGPPSAPAEGTLNEAVKVGDKVRLPGFSTAAIVTALLDDGNLEVEAGRFRMRTPREGVQRLEGAATAGPPRVAPSPKVEPVHAAESVSSQQEWVTEINVIGCTADEAQDQADKFLDDAFLAGHRKLRIIHGHGKGILRRTLHEMFASHPHVEKFYFAPRQEGGEGATIVELKR